MPDVKLFCDYNLGDLHNSDMQCSRRNFKAELLHFGILFANIFVTASISALSTAWCNSVPPVTESTVTLDEALS